MNQTAKVTIIMPVFNGEKFIEEAIKSVVEQTYENFELIIVNDGSIDNTENIVNKYLSNNKIKYFKFSNNKGKVVAINKGYNESNGELLIFLAADDVLSNDSLEMRVLSLGNENALYCNMYVCNSTLDRQFTFYNNRSAHLEWTSVKYELLLSNMVSGGTILLRKNIANQIFPIPETLMFEDWWLTFWTLFLEKKIIYLDLPLVFYRIHDNNDNGHFANSNFDKIKKKDYTRHFDFYNELSTRLLNSDSSNKNELLHIIKLNNEIKYKIINNKLFFSYKFFKIYGLKTYIIQNLISKNIAGKLILLKLKFISKV